MPMDGGLWMWIKWQWATNQFQNHCDVMNMPTDRWTYFKNWNRNGIYDMHHDFSPFIQTQWWDDALDIHPIPAGTLTAKYTHTTQMDRVVYLIAQPPMAHGMPVPVGIFELEFVNIRSTFCETGKNIDGDLFLVYFMCSFMK